MTNQTNIEFTVVANYEGEQIEMCTYTDKQKALDSKEEMEVENDTQCFIRVYEVVKDEDVKDMKWQSIFVISKKLIEII